MDDKNGDVWGYLSLLCICMTEQLPGRYVQARSCLYEAVFLQGTNYELWIKLGDMFLSKFLVHGALPYLEAGDFTEALSCYQMAKGLLEANNKSEEDLVENIQHQI